MPSQFTTQKYLSATGIAFVVTSYISFALVALNVGFSGDFLLIWLRSWLLAFLLVIPSLLFVAPSIKRSLAKLNQ